MDKRTLVYTATVITMAGMVGIWFWMLPYSIEIDSTETANPLVTSGIDTSLNDIRAQLDSAGAVLGEAVTQPVEQVETDPSVKDGDSESVSLTPEQLEFLKQQLQKTAEANQN